MVVKRNDIPIIAAIIIGLLIVKYSNLFSVYGFQPSVIKLVGQKYSLIPSGQTCSIGSGQPDYIPLDISGVARLENFSIANGYNTFTGCNPNTECVSGAYNCNPSCMNDYYAMGPCRSGQGTCLSVINQTTDSNGCIIKTWQYRTAASGCSLWSGSCWYCSYSVAQADFGGSTYITNNMCVIDFDAVLPNGTRTRVNWRADSHSPVNLGIINLSWGGDESGDIAAGLFKCSCIMINVVPNNLTLTVTYDDPPPVFVNTITKIKAHLKSNANVLNATINGHWEYQTPFGWKTEPFTAINQNISKDADNIFEIIVPSLQPVTIIFKMDSVKTGWNIGTGADNPSAAIYQQTIDLPSNSVIIHEKIACVKDSDCPLIPQCQSVIPTCMNNVCIYPNNIPCGGPIGQFQWKWLSSAWNSFVTWLKGVLGWV